MRVRLVDLVSVDYKYPTFVDEDFIFGLETLDFILSAILEGPIVKSDIEKQVWTERPSVVGSLQSMLLDESIQEPVSMIISERDKSSYQYEVIRYASVESFEKSAVFEP